MTHCDYNIGFLIRWVTTAKLLKKLSSSTFNEKKKATLELFLLTCKTLTLERLSVPVLTIHPWTFVAIFSLLRHNLCEPLMHSLFVPQRRRQEDGTQLW